jgi:hypothetical protein
MESLRKFITENKEDIFRDCRAECGGSGEFDGWETHPIGELLEKMDAEKEVEELEGELEDEDPSKLKFWGGDTTVFLPDVENDGDVVAEEEEEIPWFLTEDDIFDEETGETGKADTRTIKYLEKHRHDSSKSNAEQSLSFKKFKKTASNYTIKNGKIYKKEFDENKYHALTKDDIEQILDQKNAVHKKSSGPTLRTHGFVFVDGKLLSVPKSDLPEGASEEEIASLAKKLRAVSYKKLNKEINDRVAKKYGRDTFYRIWYAQNGDKKSYDGSMRKITGLSDKDWEIDETGLMRLQHFPKENWQDIDSSDEEKILSVLNVSSGKPKKTKKFYGYDWEKKTFTVKDAGGTERPLTDDELKKLVRELGQVPEKDARMYSWKGWFHGKLYWETFNVQTKGQKIGESDVASFSMPPGITCADNVPCLRDGCYAADAFFYNGTRAAWLKNYTMFLEPDGPQRLFDQLTAFLKHPKSKVRLFRFNVSGDIKPAGYLETIFRVAEACPSVEFWLYTKIYDRVKNVNPPRNLHIILSAWGDYFVPDVELQKKFPVAYINEGSKSEGFLDKIGNTVDQMSGGKRKKDEKIVSVGKNGILMRDKYVCPCTEYSDSKITCSSCGACYGKLWGPGGKVAYNLVFNKH